MSREADPHTTSGGARRRPDRRLLQGLAGLAVVASTVLPLAGGGAALAGSGAAGAARASAASSRATASASSINNVGQLRTAYYFGEADPINFWTSDLSGARAAFKTMVKNGFNAVGLTLPWGYFQPQLTPPVENKTAFERLDKLIGIAQQVGLVVVLRLSFEYDSNPGDQLPWHQRQIAMYRSNRPYNAWLDYISAVNANVARFGNVAMAYLSWEDFWDPVGQSSNLTDYNARLALASQLGYQTWLSHHFSLSQVDQIYGQTFGGYNQVPTPLRSQTAFQLMFTFDDWMFVNRFFYPAQARFPGLTIEARDESDIILNNGQPYAWYSHSSTYQLAGAPMVGTYYSPYMMDPSTDHNETAGQADWSLYSVLTNFGSQTGGRPIVVHEFEFVSNAPQVTAAPMLSPSQVPQFLRDSGPTLAQHSHGYGLWTYRNFNFSTIFNPNFALGTKGWSTYGSPKAQRYASGVSYLAMPPKATVSQKVAPSHLTMGTSPYVHVNLDAKAASPSQLTVVLSGNRQTINVGTKWHTYVLTFPESQLGNGWLKLVNHGVALNTSNIQLYGFTQTGDIYKTNGRADFALGALQQMNAEMAADG